MATNCPQHVNPRAWRSASVRFTRAWNSVRGNSLRSWLNMLENSRTGEPPSCGVSMLGRFDPTIRQVAHPSPNPNWDKAQFRHINASVKKALAARIPVLSVDTKKKELVGNYANAGRQWRPVRHAPRVQGHDFPSPDVPRAYPYGIYDVGRNAGFVNVGTDHDTAAFAVASIRGWWRAEGRRLYRKARSILITADAGGSHGSRLRLWKWELQRLADETARTLSVCHF